MKYLAEIVQEVKGLVRDRDGVLAERDYESSINQALWILSRIAPRESSVVIAGDGVTYAWALPSDYYGGFSSILRVLYPYTSLVEYTELDPDYYAVLLDSVLRLILTVTPSASESLRCDYSTIHVVTESSSTLTPPQEHQIDYAAAAICCLQLASHYAQHRASTIDADAIDFAMKSNQYLRLSEDYRKISGLGSQFDSDSMRFACAIRDFDPPPPWSSDSDFMIHHRGRR